MCVQLQPVHLLFCSEPAVVTQCFADTCPTNFTKATGFAQIVSPHSAATVTLKMTAAGVVVFTSSGTGHCEAGVLVNIVVSQGNACCCQHM